MGMILPAMTRVVRSADVDIYIRDLCYVDDFFGVSLECH